MLGTKVNLSIFLIVAVSITGCDLQGNAQKKQETLESQKKEVAQIQEKEWTDYEPAIVELRGKLDVKTYFGPPNFGENPKTDSKERSWILSLERPLNVRAKTKSDPASGPSVEDVRELQLVLPNPQRELIGKRVIVKGTLFHAQTGHHHTDILMDVQSISLDVK